MFDVIKRAHIAMGHGKIKWPKKFEPNTRTSLMISLRFSNCSAPIVNLKKRPTTKGIVVRPLLTTDFHSSAQIDLIDM